MRLDPLGNKSLLQFSTQRATNGTIFCLLTKITIVIKGASFKELECKLKKKKSGHASNRSSQERENSKVAATKKKMKGVSTVRLKEMKESDHSYKSIGLNSHSLKMQNKFCGGNGTSGTILMKTSEKHLKYGS